MSYKKLFEKGNIGGVKLKNRIVMPAMGTSFASSTGEASDEIIRYYEDRAKGGCGLIITEITRIDHETGVGMSNQLSATDSRYIPRLVKLADAIHRHDSKIFLQLQHPGRQTYSHLLNGKQVVAPSPIACNVVKEQPRELTTAECEALAKKFVTGAVIAQRSGIDGVELHAAHGYLINQFISPYTNKRTDKYGGDFYNRMRFITEIILGIQAACGPKFPIVVRIDGCEFVEGGMTIADGVKVARYLESLGIAALNVSAGTYESGYSVIEPACLPEGWKRHLAEEVKKNVKIPVIAANNIKHPSFAESLLEENVCDFVAIGRCHLADPEWGNKAKTGRDHEIRKCIGCMNCFKVANTGRAITCTVNPNLGRELQYNEQTLNKNGANRKIAVIGGGPGGMQAAIILAKRGYSVVIYDKNTQLGGTMILAAKPDHKELLGEFIETMIGEIEALDIEVKLNTEATVDMVKELNPYGVILACGGNDIIPNVPGVHGANVYSAEDVLLDKAGLEGKKVAVIGGGVTGLETAEMLSKKNQVTIIEMMNDVGTTLYASVKAMLLKRLSEAGVTIMTGHALTGIQDNKINLMIASSAFETELETDAVVLALGVRTRNTLIEEFEEAFEKVTTVGNASTPGDIVKAIQEGNDKAYVF